ncbi:MAG: hypothetical protein ACOYN0_13800 [Phycisphaerales bacterium]
MSWDLFIQSIPAKYKTMSEIPEGFTPKPLGSQTKVIKAIRSVLPGILFEQGFANVNSDDGHVDIDMGLENPVHCVALTCGGGESILPVVRSLVAALGGRAFDASSDSGIFDPDAAAMSLGTANAHRNKATAKASKKPVKKASKTAPKKAAAKKSPAKKTAKKAAKKVAKTQSRERKIR